MALLTQTPIIQQCNQYFFLSISSMLQKWEMNIMLRNITQAYTQSKIELNCIVISHLLAELKKKYSKDTVLYVSYCMV